MKYKNCQKKKSHKFLKEPVGTPYVLPYDSLALSLWLMQKHISISTVRFNLKCWNRANPVELWSS